MASRRNPHPWQNVAGSSREAAIGVVSTIGYLGFLGGPPLIGSLGNQYGVFHALMAIALVLCLSIVLAGPLQPLGRVGRPPD